MVDVVGMCHMCYIWLKGTGIFGEQMIWLMLLSPLCPSRIIEHAFMFSKCEHVVLVSPEDLFIFPSEILMSFICIANKNRQEFLRTTICSNLKTCLELCFLQISA